jgi:hypothetical protein
MIKSILIVAVMLSITAFSAQAQSRDTLKPKQKERTQDAYDKSKAKRAQGTQQEATANMRNRKAVLAKDVPAALRQTLQGPDYKGWDANTSTIYSDRSGKRFTIEIRNGTSSKIYHFDREGNRVDAGSEDRE